MKLCLSVVSGHLSQSTNSFLKPASLSARIQIMKKKAEHMSFLFMVYFLTFDCPRNFSQTNFWSKGKYQDMSHKQPPRKVLFDGIQMMSGIQIMSHFHHFRPSKDFPLGRPSHKLLRLDALLFFPCSPSSANLRINVYSKWFLMVAEALRNVSDAQMFSDSLSEKALKRQSLH